MALKEAPSPIGLPGTARLWAVGPTMMETLFDAAGAGPIGGRLANYGATVADYRETTLTAFQQVEDNLSALRILEPESLQQREAVAEAQRGVQLFTARYEAAVDPYLQVISAQTIALLNERNDVDVLRLRMDASVLLVKGLGGGGTSRSHLKSARCTDLSQRQDTRWTRDAITATKGGLTESSLRTIACSINYLQPERHWQGCCFP